MTADQSNDDPTQSFVALVAGTKVQHYKIIKNIGVGGMGEVYLAEDTALKRRVALKFLPNALCHDEASKARFTREAQAAAKLDHPNIVTVYEVGDHGGRPFFAMQHIEGKPLRDLIKEDFLSLSRAVSIVIQICEGLTEAHSAGVIHRDIKPGNIILDKNSHPKLVDFGLAAVSVGERLTASGTTMGTAGYMSPEQAQGQKIDQRSDLFSLGVVLYEMIAGRRPFGGKDLAATLHAITHDTPEPLARFKADVPAELQRIVIKTLEKNPDARYQHADDLLVDLKQLAQGMDTATLPVSATPVSPTRRLLKVSLPVVLVLVLLVVYWMNRAGQFSQAPLEKHLAVLPFANLGDAVTSQAFCDGLMETLTSKLTQMAQFEGALCVVPASEIRERDVASVRQARKVFGITHAVTGSIQRQNGDIRMTLNLVDAKTERQLRSAVIDEEMANVSALQDSTVSEMAMMLDVPLGAHDQAVLSAGGTRSPTAYYAYVQALGILQRYFHKYENAVLIDTAIDLFHDAIKNDGGYALAYAGLGEAFWRKYDWTMDIHCVDSAIKYSRIALDMSDQLAPVYVTLGLIYKGTGRYEEAAGCFEKALAIDAVCLPASRELALTHEVLGNYDLAEATYSGAIALMPDSWGGYFDLAKFYMSRGQSEDALEQLHKAEFLAPNAVIPCNDLGALYLYLGHIDEARIMLEHSLELQPNYAAYSNLGVIHHMQGRYAEAAEMYEQALKIDDHDFRVWMNLAEVLTKSDPKKSRATYQRAIEEAERHRQVNPQDPWLLCYLGTCYAAIADTVRALELAGQAAELARKNVEIMVRVSVIYQMSGQRDTALDWASKAVEYGFPVSELENIAELAGLVNDLRLDSLAEGQ